MIVFVDLVDVDDDYTSERESQSFSMFFLPFFDGME